MALSLIRPKCVFGVAHPQFLGLQVDSEGIRSLEEKIQTIQDFPQPTTQRKLHEFLGLVNLYHHFLQKCTTLFSHCGVRMPLQPSLHSKGAR